MSSVFARCWRGAFDLHDRRSSTRTSWSDESNESKKSVKVRVRYLRRLANTRDHLAQLEVKHACPLGVHSKRRKK